MQYFLVSATTAQELSDKVNERLARNWEPIGSPFTEKGTFYQALIYKQNKA